MLMRVSLLNAELALSLQSLKAMEAVYGARVVF